MSILVYGGGFNPPHLGHAAALQTAIDALSPKRVIVLPDGTPPHKPLPDGTPPPEERLRLCELAFGTFPRTEISDLAIKREGPCYMVDSAALLRERFPGKKLILLLGADMLMCLDQWHRARELMEMCSFAALCRGDEDGASLRQKAAELRRAFGADIQLLPHRPVAVCSSQIRVLLPKRMGSELLAPGVYAEIIRGRFYGAQPSLAWLRQQVYPMLKPRRVRHVAGCEDEARKLAQRWGVDPELAAEAGILHDMTKRWSDEEQLRYCQENGIVLDPAERVSPQLLHARTGAFAAHALFGAPELICDAIRWHTTGKPDMTTFEKILYLADMTEPNRDFPGVEELRAVCREDLDRAMALALQMSVRIIQERKMDVYQDTLEACRWYKSRVHDEMEE